ncbi:MAG TPA: ParB/RepB/Spo0J family partition protein [Terriglobales bacterium]|nr:ParB/RepB/Spo0J family partition protein [Terriglobales bacterium]
MAAIEEHKPAEKRRALGRGLDSLLPSGPRVVSPPVPANPPRTATSEPHGPSVPSPIVIPTATTPPVVSGSAAPVVAPDQEYTTPTDSHGAEIAEIHASSHFSQKQREAGHPADIIEQIPLDLIDENPYQTRKTFDEAALKELAESIKANGLAQPVVVRPGSDGRYVLVLGERRCRASKLAGKTSVPAIVRPLGNEQAAEMTIVENLQRQDLNCLEQAQAFARLSREFNLTQEQIAKRVGSSRESVANYMRLLKLPQGVLDLVGEGRLGFSEARVLLEALPHTTPSAIELMARSAADGNLTVRHLKLQVDRIVNPELNAPEPPKQKALDPNVRDAERRLREALGMRVRVLAYQGNKGQVVIRYESLADFDRIFEMLSREI